MNTRTKKLLTLIVCIALILPLLLAVITPQRANAYDVTDFKGLKLSILGDSISTYKGYSNNADYNSNIGGNYLYYGNTNSSGVEQYYGVDSVDMTWWKQAIDILGMELCVDNAWSGSYVGDAYTGRAGYRDIRAKNLHQNTGSSNVYPDIIAVYMGTNDLKNSPYDSGDTDNRMLPVGTYDTINFSHASFTNNNTRPSTVLEAYAVMLHKIKATYPDAELYCFTLLPQNGGQCVANLEAYNAFNEGVVQLAAKYGAYVVDLYHDSGVTHDLDSLEYHLANDLHPNPNGMDAITNCFVSALLENSKYRSSNTTVHSITYNMDNVYVPNGNIGAAVHSSPLTVNLATEGNHHDINVTVTMGGKDITDQCRKGNTIVIDSVSDDVTITASLGENNHHYRWDNTNGQFQSSTAKGAIYNHAEMTTGTEASGTFTDAQYRLDQTVYLSHNQPWVVEWKSSNLSSNVLFMTMRENTSTEGNRYIFLTKAGMVFMGHQNKTSSSSTHFNYGVDVSDTVDVTDSTAHVYKLVNEIDENGDNMIYLYVDGNNHGPMTTHYISSDSYQGDNDTTLSGMDFEFRFLGTNSHYLNMKLDYIEVWENGIEEFTPNTYRWETKNGELVSISGDDYTNNYANLLSGSYSGGMYRSSYFSLSEDIVLMHDRPWCIEWKSTGNWTGGAMLFSASNIENAPYAPYLYRRPNSQFIALGERDYADNQHENYGVSLSDHDVNGITTHTYQLINYLENDTNQVYLFVDGEKLGAMENLYYGGTAQGSTSSWVSGKDFTFSYIGTERFPLNDCNISYIQVWEDDGFLHDPTLDFSRLTQLLSDEYALTNDGYTAASWNAYQTALSNAQNATPTSQEEIDLLVRGLTDARTALVTDSGSGQILDIDLISGSYAYAGRQIGLSITTDPNVASLTVSLNGVTQTLDVSSAKVQTNKNGETVKVWLISLKAPDTAGTYECTICAGSVTQTKSITVK